MAKKIKTKHRGEIFLRTKKLNKSEINIAFEVVENYQSNINENFQIRHIFKQCVY